MNKQRLILLIVALALMGATAAVLARYRSAQQLGSPGVRTRPAAGGSGEEVVLPEQVLDYSSQPMEQAQIVLDTLPKDTSFGQRMYQSPDGAFIQMNVVLMGADRTSLHKPQMCIPGQGIQIEQTEMVAVPISQPHPYDLPVIKLTVGKAADAQGNAMHGLYMYWYVADQEVSADASALRRMWLSSKKLFLTGKQPRWAYVSCFTIFPAGQGAACFERVKQFLAAAVPQFQLATGAPAPDGRR